MIFKQNVNIELENLIQKWKLLHARPDVFKYKLNILDRRHLPGPHKIYTEFNPDRTSLRRQPHVIPNLRSEFDENKFNFHKIDVKEKLLKLQYNEVEISFVINNSPLTLYHSIICPNIFEKQNQCITDVAINFAVEFLQELDDKDFRIGYNSPGAAASINHLHLHLVYITQNLYIDNVELQHLKNNYIYRLHDELPTEGICFILYKDEDSQQAQMKLKTIYDFTKFLCDENLPHNIFITKNRNNERCHVRVFVFLRANYGIHKDFNEINIGFCELVGYVPVGNKSLFESLSEEKLFAKICVQTGDAYEKAYKYFENVNKFNE